MVATASTPMSGAGDRRNAATSGERPLVRGAATLVTEALQVARPLWSLWTGYSSRRFGVLYPRVVTAAHEAGARFSITAPLYPSVTKGNRRHRRQCVDPDPLPAGDLRRSRATFDL